MIFTILKIYWSAKSATLMDAPSRSAELFICDLEPLKHKAVALIRARMSFALIQYMTVLHGLCHFSDSCSTNLLRKDFASLPIRPSTENHSGVKLTCFSSHAFRYLDFFSFSAFSRTACGVYS